MAGGSVWIGRKNLVIQLAREIGDSRWLQSARVDNFGSHVTVQREKGSIQLSVRDTAPLPMSRGEKRTELTERGIFANPSKGGRHLAGT
ncbi:hypothetical protein RIB2604_03102860 [Aspergillus luchuensis]|uniref:Uncharacterized protein n=1 Tax=Aspergillus kawachii TaxID=1069201 RepID=A0A146FW60_ASPKA|nr:hypothetical protein RIB2604_03102860 [Aspergillus luchuensis]